MGKVLATMIGRDGVARVAGDTSQGLARARCVVADALLDETPDGLDRIEVVRVRGQVFDARAAGFDREVNFARFVRLEGVEGNTCASTTTGVLTRAWADARGGCVSERLFES